MRYGYRGVLGILLVWMSFLHTKDHVAIIRDGIEDHNQVQFSCQPSQYPQSWREPVSLTKLDVLQAYIQSNQFCLARYNMPALHLHDLLKLKYSCIVAALLKLDDLSDGGIIELWDLYKKDCWRKGKIQQCEEELQQGLQDRAQQRQSEQFCRFVKQQHKEVADSLYWHDVSEELYALRDQALQQSELEGFQQYDRLYDIDLILRGYCIAKGIDYHAYEHCMGTALQQQYHAELCDTLHDLAEQELLHTRTTHCFAHASNFVEAAHEANQKAWLGVTGVLSSIAHSFLEVGKDIWARPLVYLQAMGAGVYESASDFVHMVTHPLDSLYGVGQMIYYVLETAALSEAARLCPIDKHRALHEQRTRTILHGLSSMQKQFASLDGPGRVKVLTKFGADFYIPAKITAACSHLFAGVCSRAKGMRSLEGAASVMGDEFGIAEIFSEVEKAEVALEGQLNQHITSEFMEAEKIIGGASYVPRGVNWFIQEFKKVKGAIPLHNVNLKNECLQVLKSIEQQLKRVQLEKIVKMYGERLIDNKKVQAAIEHMCNFELGLQKSREASGYILKIGGGHLPGVCEALEKTGLVKIVSKEILATGVTDYVLENVFTGKRLSKTVFPQGWTEEKLAKAIWEVYENPVKKDVLLDDRIHYKRVGLVDNIEIEITFRNIVQKNGSKNRDVCNIKTIMPYL